MIQCSECEYFRRGDNGEVSFACDPFSTIKEPECLAKWELIKSSEVAARLQGVQATLQQLADSYRAMIDYQQRLQPMQDKMFRFVEREMEDVNEAEKWKLDDEEDPEDWGHPTL